MTASRTTLADVARLSGVSKTSASMALADSPRVAAETKVRVRAAARQLGYVPHFAASSLRSQRVDAIAVVVPHDTQHVFSHPFFIDILEGVLTKANENDISPILSTARTASDESSAYSRILRGRMASGVIVAAASTTDQNVAAIADAGYPVVVVGRSPKLPGIVTVGVDDQGGAQLAVEHLISVHGAKRIGHVSGPLNHQSAIDKRVGYVQALSDAGLELNPRLQYEGDYTEESGAAAARALLPEIGNCDALFFANDQMAVAAMEFFASHGVTVPDQLRIVGYDDHPTLRYSHPAITTVRGDMVEVGVQSMTKLMQLLAGDTDVENLELPTELVVRESCGCP
ncbi:MAG: LacI family transcriptional regulator [Glaciihabitans sp.]|jgi:DNA-binding LacI/PurR family transcriptional regulator|nr:LacI family transcriptional regulator [Glaciihabitans sp.]